jgi:hypothetical protein
LFHDIFYSENAYVIVVQYKCPSCFNWQNKGRRGRDHMVVGLQLNMKSVPITTNVVRSNPEKRKTKHNVGTIPKSYRKIVETGRNRCT